MKYNFRSAIIVLTVCVFLVGFYVEAAPLPEPSSDVSAPDISESGRGLNSDKYLQWGRHTVFDDPLYRYPEKPEPKKKSSEPEENSSELSLFGKMFLNFTIFAPYAAILYGIMDTGKNNPPVKGARVIGNGYLGVAGVYPMFAVLGGGPGKEVFLFWTVTLGMAAYNHFYLARPGSDASRERVIRDNLIGFNLLAATPLVYAMIVGDRGKQKKARENKSRKTSSSFNAHFDGEKMALSFHYLF